VRKEPNLRRRRSQRVTLSVPITVSEPQSNDGVIVERTHTLAVSRHGGLIALRASVDPGQSLLMTNTASRVSKECRVVYLGPHYQNAWQVGIEFLDPLVDFWNISFPAPRSKPMLD
jgi:PilZ domain-containing protein